MFQNLNVTDRELRWTVMSYFYVRFFEKNSELDDTKIKLESKTDFKYVEQMLLIRKHPYFDRCITFQHNIFKKSGLYYTRAK